MRFSATKHSQKTGSILSKKVKLLCVFVANLHLQADFYQLHY